MLGIGLGLGRTINFNSSPAALIVTAFKNRALADGGTFEAYDCAVNNIQLLLNIDLYPVGDAVMSSLQTRTVTDSGTFEAYNCGIIQIQNLANINL